MKFLPLPMRKMISRAMFLVLTFSLAANDMPLSRNC